MNNVLQYAELLRHVCAGFKSAEGLVGRLWAKLFETHVHRCSVMTDYNDLLSSSTTGFPDSLEDNPFADATSHNTNVAQSMIEQPNTPTTEDYGQMSKSLNNLSLDEAAASPSSGKNTPYEQPKDDTEPEVSTQRIICVVVSQPSNRPACSRAMKLNTPIVCQKAAHVRFLK